MAHCFGRLFWYLEKGDGFMALWGGRFEAGVTEVTQEFGASLPVDKHLYKQRSLSRHSATWARPLW